MDPIIDRLKPLDGGRILDVATGSGDFLRLLTESFGRYTEAIGIDFSRRIVPVAEKLSDAPYQLKEMDAENIDYHDGYFDTVAIRHSLHHLTRREAVLAEMKRVLKPGGLLIIGEVYQDPKTEQPNSQRHLHHWWAEVDQVFGIPHYATFTRDEVLAVVSAAGWTIDDAFDYCEELTETDLQEGLDMMLQHTESLIDKLQNESDRPFLVEQGRQLVERFRKLGFTNEAMLYILARN